MIRAWKKVVEEPVEEVREEVEEVKPSLEQQIEKAKETVESHREVKKEVHVKKEHVKEPVRKEEKLSEVQESTKEACEKFLHDALKTMGMEVEISSSIRSGWRFVYRDAGRAYGNSHRKTWTDFRFSSVFDKPCS